MWVYTFFSLDDLWSDWYSLPSLRMWACIFFLPLSLWIISDPTNIHSLFLVCLSASPSLWIISDLTNVYCLLSVCESAPSSLWITSDLTDVHCLRMWACIFFSGWSLIWLMFITFSQNVSTPSHWMIPNLTNVYHLLSACEPASISLWIISDLTNVHCLFSVCKPTPPSLLVISDLTDVHYLLSGCKFAPPFLWMILTNVLLSSLRMWVWTSSQDNLWSLIWLMFISFSGC